MRLAVAHCARAFLIALWMSFLSVSGLAQEAPAQVQFTANFTVVILEIPAPIAISSDSDMLTLSTILTATNVEGRGLLHNLTGRCLTWLITDKAADTVEQHGHCNYVDPEGDIIYEKVDFELQRIEAIRIGVGHWMGGTGKYADLRGSFAIRVTTLKPAVEGLVQAVGEKRGSYTSANPALIK